MQKEFEIYNVIPNSEMLRKVRKAFIATLDKPVFKIISSTPFVWMPRKEVYDFKEIFGDVYYAFSYVPVSEFSLNYVQNFIKYGPESPETLKAIRYEGEDLYFYSKDDMVKKGKKYQVPLSIMISEDIYNLSKIQFKDFKGLTKDDISMYSKYFTVSDTPSSIVSETFFEDLCRNGLITSEQCENIIENLELERHFVRSLKNK